MASHGSTRKHRNRRGNSAYEMGGQPVLVTICTRNRQPVLTTGSMPRILDSGFRSASAYDSMEILVWCVMNLLVVPSSQAPNGPFELTSVLKNMTILIVCIGLPITLITNYFASDREVQPQ